MAKRTLLAALALAFLATLIWFAGGGLFSSQSATQNLSPEIGAPTAGETTLDESPRAVDSGVEVAGRERLEPGEEASAGPAYALTGRIKIRPGIPIDGARVQVYEGKLGDRKRSMSSPMEMQATGSTSLGRGGFKIEGEPIATAEVAPDGSFTFQDLKQHNLRVALQHGFYALLQPEAVHVEAEAKRFDLGRLESYCGGLIRGRILAIDDPRGKTIGAMGTMDPMMVMKQPDLFFASMTNRSGQETQLDEAGQFEIAAVWPSPQIRLIQQDTDSYVRSETFALQAGEIREVLLQASKTAHLAVQVRDETGELVSEARVSASPVDASGDLMSRSKLTRTETTDADGKVRITGLIPGVYSLHVKQPGLLDYLGEHPTSDLEVQVTLGKGGSISGTVVDSSGATVAGAKIMEVPVVSVPLMGDVTGMIGPGALARGARNSKIISDAEGRFEVTGLPQEGPFAFGAYHEDFVGGLKSGVKAQDQNVEIVLERAGSILGRVLGVDKKPLAKFEVRTVVKMMMILDRPTSIERISDSEDGSFTMATVPPGTVTLRIQAEDYGRWEKRVTVEEGVPVDLGEIQLSAAAIVRGRVLSPDGLPVVDARVTVKTGGLANNPMLAMLSPVAEAKSNSAGYFELRGLRPKPLTLQATAEGHASGDSDRLRLAEGQLLEGVEIRLSAGGSIAGRLILPEGGSPDAWDIFASLQPQGFMAGAELQDDLSFRIDNLDPGNYQVQAMDISGFTRMNAKMARETVPGRPPNVGKLIGDAQDLTIVTRARVREGEVTEVILDGSDHEAFGTTLDCRVWVGEQPMDEGFVEVQALSGNQPRISMAIVKDGVLRLDGLEAGVIQLQARSGLTMGPLGEAHSVEIPEGVATHHCEWHIPGGVLSGQVLDSETNQPVAGAMVRVRSEISLREGRDQDFGFALSDGDGRFAFKGLAAGTYKLIAESNLFGGEGNAAARLDALALTADSSLTDLVLRIQPGSGISIRVAGPGGSPVTGALILAVDGEGQPIGSMPIARSNSKGEAWLAGLPSGETRIVARAPGLAPAASAIQQVLPGQLGEFRVNLSRGTNVTIKLVDQNGATLSGARVSARWPGGPWLPTTLLAPTKLADGSLDLGPLPVGEIEFSISHPRAQFTARRLIPKGKKATLVISPE